MIAPGPELPAAASATQIDAPGAGTGAGGSAAAGTDGAVAAASRSGYASALPGGPADENGAGTAGPRLDSLEEKLAQIERQFG